MDPNKLTSSINKRKSVGSNNSGILKNKDSTNLKPVTTNKTTKIVKETEPNKNQTNKNKVIQKKAKNTDGPNTSDKKINNLNIKNAQNVNKKNDQNLNASNNFKIRNSRSNIPQQNLINDKNNNESKIKSNNLELEIKKLKAKLEEKERNNVLLVDENKELKFKQDRYNEEIKSLNEKLKEWGKKYNDNSFNDNKRRDKINSLNNEIKEWESKYNNILIKCNNMNEDINSLNKKLKEGNQKYEELYSNASKISEENKLLKNEVKDIYEKYNKCKSISNDKIKSDIKEKESMSLKKYKRKYDMAIKINLLNELINGWDIKYGNEGKNKYIDMKNKDILLIGLIGLKNKGKSFILSKLLKENEYEKEENDELYLKYNSQKNLISAFIDTPGLCRSLKIYENEKYNNDKYIKELEAYNIQTDNFIINFILKKSNFVICVVGFLDYNEQKLLKKLKSKDEEYKIEFKELKKLFIIHNLKELSTKNEISNYINNILLKSLTFELNEKEGNLAQNTLNSNNNNTKYFIEKNKNKELEIYHLIMAKDNTEAGNYYNESTITFIIQQYNSFHSFIKFDLIKEIKEDIKLISKNILNKPIDSLDDFESTENKIKLKNKYEFCNDLDNNINSDFSYLTLRPKYSYYKVNNNTQLLIIIEMAGEIVDQKFVCSKSPKNGYYIMTFSGRKVINLPENLDDNKKKGLFSSNIEGGFFSEEIKIDIDNFQLKSTKYTKKEEGKGIYKYYFELVNDNSSSDED